jgi:Smg protein
MLDTLFFLYDSYSHAEVAPPRDQLVRKLENIYVDQDMAKPTLDWLERYAGLSHSDHTATYGNVSGFRCYAAPELERLDAACRGGIASLENSGMLDATQRERVIEGLLALDENEDEDEDGDREEIELDHVKRVAILVLWGRNGSDKLLPADEIILDDAFFPPN